MLVFEGNAETWAVNEYLLNREQMQKIVKKIVYNPKILLAPEMFQRLRLDKDWLLDDNRKRTIRHLRLTEGYALAYLVTIQKWHEAYAVWSTFFFILFNNTTYMVFSHVINVWKCRWTTYFFIIVFHL